MLWHHDERYFSMTRKGRKIQLGLALSCLLLTACATIEADPGSENQEAPRSADRPVTGGASGGTAETPALPPADGDEVAYKVWSAEIFGSEGQFEKAASEYLAAALLSDDPEIAARATEVAISAQSWQVAAMAADRWVLLDPGSVQARETAIRTLLVGGDYVRAEIQFLGLLSQVGDEPWSGWARVPPLLTPARNIERARELIDHLEAETGAENNPYVRHARSRVAARAGEFERALDLAEEAVLLAPKEAVLHAWAGRLALSQRQQERALEHYRMAWQLTPDRREPALAYAELLRQSGRPAEADEVLEKLSDTPENRFTRIAFATESGNRALARDLYAGFRSVSYADAMEAAFQAARSAEVLELKEEAIGWYEQLDGGERELVALLRRAFLLAEIGRLDEARQVLVAARNGGRAAVQLETVLAEAQILAEAGRQGEAFSVLEKALDQFPTESRLLYTRALIAVDLGRIEEAEADLRTVLAEEPSNAAALNALGYTLADLTDRYEEAEQLVRRAYELEPDDPAIIDSMGWVAYRLGRLEEAERFLRQALLRQRNAEIAAHLGEVLWVQGREGDARRVWNEAMRMDPSDRVLRETLERFDVKL
jgi:tetratricopeptide (TPR) repeat protein